MLSPDVELLVTTDDDEIKRLPAHKNVLVAMSSVIATKLTRRWEEGGEGRDVIEIPPEVGVEAVEMFLEFLYTEELEQGLSVELYLDLFFLADHYEVGALMSLCDGILIDKLDVGNCVKIYEKSRLFQNVKCGTVAFNLLKKNLGRILTSATNELMAFNAYTWKSILELNYLFNVEEIELFKLLKKWKDENVEERSSDFYQLIKLIRFPLVGVENFAEFVVSSRELDAEIMLQMFVYFVGKGPVPFQFANCQPRNLSEPTGPKELQEIIEGSNSGDIIELEGNYAPFVIPANKTDLTIRAKPGKEAVIKADSFGIKIKGQRCKIQGLSIIFTPNQSISYGVKVEAKSTHNILKDLSISGGFYGMYIHGRQNSISNISINDPKFGGLCLASDSKDNEVTNCSVAISSKKLQAYGFAVMGAGGNKLSNLISNNTIANEVRCSENFVYGWEIKGTFHPPGLTLFSGSNSIENVHIAGRNAVLELCDETEYNLIKDCVTDTMKIKGGSHTIKRLKAEQILVAKEKLLAFPKEQGPHTLKNCEAKLLKIAKRAKIESIGCKFQLTEKVNSLD